MKITQILVARWEAVEHVIIGLGEDNRIYKYDFIYKKWILAE